jgi:hypothetical protein
MVNERQKVDVSGRSFFWTARTGDTHQCTYLRLDESGFVYSESQPLRRRSDLARHRVVRDEMMDVFHSDDPMQTNPPEFGDIGDRNHRARCLHHLPVEHRFRFVVRRDTTLDIEPVDARFLRRNIPPSITMLRRSLAASTDRISRSFVRTVMSSSSGRKRAICNVVVPESSTIDSPGETIAAASLPIRTFSSAWLERFTSTGGSAVTLTASALIPPP